MKAIASVLVLFALVTGCARHTTTDPNAAPKIKDRAACEAAGGKWKAITRHCDMD
jgi:hypothetical protein